MTAETAVKTGKADLKTAPPGDCVPVILLIGGKPDHFRR